MEITPNKNDIVTKETIFKKGNHCNLYSVFLETNLIKSEYVFANDDNDTFS